MMLKDSAWAVIGALLMLLFMGYLTSGLVFYGAAVLLLMFLAMDGSRLWSMRANVRKVSVARSLSRHEVAPGLSTCLMSKLTYHGHRTLQILVSQPMYRSITTNFTEQSLSMTDGSTADIAMDLYAGGGAGHS